MFPITNVYTPLKFAGPFHPPLAIQLFAFVELQVSVVLLPSGTVVGDADRFKVGGGVGGGGGGTGWLAEKEAHDWPYAEPPPSNLTHIW